MALIQVPVPDLGDISDAAIIEILVKVGDTIAAEHLPRVFDRFTRVDPARQRDNRGQFAATLFDLLLPKNAGIGGLRAPHGPGGLD
mgnify:CR=1 FL=1